MTDADLTLHRTTSEPTSATLRVNPGTSSELCVNPTLFGKFAEQLVWNIYKGIDA